MTAGENWVRVMADDCSDGLWDHDGLMLDEEDVPISERLAERLRAWCDASDPDSAPDMARLGSEGLAIARAIKAELPDWTVIYHDVSRRRPGDRAQPLADYEYEVQPLTD